MSTNRFRECTYFHRDNSQDYYNYIFDKRDGIMEKYEKDCHGDPANPINAQISGLFFSATTGKMYGGRPSIFGDKRVKIEPHLLFNDNTNLYFADFYCIYSAHCIQLVVTENQTQVDETCRKLLIKLNKYDNPFLYISKDDPKIITVTITAPVEVFYTHDINLQRCGINKSNKSSIETAPNTGSSRIGGQRKNPKCTICNI